MFSEIKKKFNLATLKERLRDLIADEFTDNGKVNRVVFVWLTRGERENNHVIAHILTFLSVERVSFVILNLL